MTICTGSLPPAAGVPLDRPLRLKVRNLSDSPCIVPLAPVAYIDRAVIVAALVVFSGALFPFSPDRFGLRTGEYESDLLLFSFQLGIYGLIVLLALRRPAALIRYWHTPVWGFAALALISAGWSSDPVFTAKKASVLVATCLLALYAIVSMGMVGLARLLRMWLLAMCVVSIILAFVDPETGTMLVPGGSAWRGVFPHKNWLGRYVALGLILEFAVAQRASPSHAISALMFTFVLFMSGSVTALATCAAVLVALVFTRWLSSRRSLAVAVLSLVLALTIVGFAFGDNVPNVIGRDATLTGRTELWKLLTGYVSQRPILGYGYAAFWLPMSPTIESQVGWTAGQAHSGYLDLALQLGLTGCLVIAVSVIAVVFRLIRLPQAQALEKRVAGTIVAFVLLASVTEGGLTGQNSVLWILYVAVASWTAGQPVGLTATAKGRSRAGSFDTTALGRSSIPTASLAHGLR